MVIYFLFIFLLLLIFIFLYKYINLSEQFISKKENGKKKFNIIIHDTIDINNVKMVVNMCNLYFGKVCNNIEIHNDLKKKLNKYENFIIVYNGKTNDKFYNKYIKNRKSSYNILIINYKNISKNDIIEKIKNKFAKNIL